MDVYDFVEVAPGVWEPGVKPGLYRDLSNDEYQRSPGISKSHLDDICPESGHTPAHYWDKRINPDKPEVKAREEWQVLGDAIHKAILEPDLMSQFAYVPDDAPAKPTAAMRTSKNPSASSLDRVSWWDDFERENEGKTVLPKKMCKALFGARDAVHMHPVARGLFVGGSSEQSFYAIDPETGALVKCRTDYEQLERHGRIVDLKTTDDAAPAAFKRSMRKFRYDVQDVHYTDTIHKAFDATNIVREFVFVAIEKIRPFVTGIYWIEASDRPPARALARRDINTILDCRRTDLWPDFGCNPQSLKIDRREITL